MSTETSSARPTALTRWRPHLPALTMLVVISIVLGIWPLMGTWIDFVPYIAAPSALGLPFGIPVLSLTPVGGTTWPFVLVDAVAVAVMIAVVGMRLVNSAQRHPSGGMPRRFVAGWAATILGVIIGNLVRLVFASIVVHADIPAYLGLLLGTVLVSAIWGVIVGIPVGLVAMLRRRVRCTSGNLQPLQ